MLFQILLAAASLEEVIKPTFKYTRQNRTIAYCQNHLETQSVCCAYGGAASIHWTFWIKALGKQLSTCRSPWQDGLGVCP